MLLVTAVLDEGETGVDCEHARLPSTMAYEYWRI